MMIKVNSSVEQGGKNLFKDVKTVQALVNVYLRSINESLFYRSPVNVQMRSLRLLPVFRKPQ